MNNNLNNLDDSLQGKNIDLIEVNEKQPYRNTYKDDLVN